MLTTYNVIESARKYDILFVFRRGYTTRLVRSDVMGSIRASLNVYLYMGNGVATQVGLRGIEEVRTNWSMRYYRVYIGRLKRHINYKVMNTLIERAMSEGRFKPTLIERVACFFGRKKRGYQEGSKVSAEYIALAFKAAAGVDLVPGVDFWDITPLDLIQSNEITVRYV